MRALVLAVLSLVIAASAQAPTPPAGTSDTKTVVTGDITGTPPVAPLTDHEVAMYRSAQIRLVKAQIDIAEDAKWKELQAAQAALNTLPGEFMRTRKIDPATHGLCDGPVDGSHVCDGLVRGELALRTLTPVPAPAVKPAEVKK